MKIFVRRLIKLILLGLILWLIFGQLDHALRVESYQTCLSIPEEMRKVDCEYMLVEP
jgi:hypothetical protein